MPRPLGMSMISPLRLKQSTAKNTWFHVRIGALTHDVFEIAGLSPVHDVDHLILHGRMLCHAPPFGEQKVLL
jgi:hypothetical protein